MKKLFCTVITSICLSLMQPCYALSLNVVDGEVRDVIAALGTLANKNIIADASCTGKITLNIQNMDFDQALDLITTSKGLSLSYMDNVIVVMSDEQAAKNLHLSIHKLEYTRANEIKEVLQSIVPAGRISSDAVSNSILFYGSAKDEEKLKKAIATLDTPGKQVTLEAKILSISRENSLDLGINWSWDALPQRKVSSENNNNLYEGHFKFWRGYSFDFSAKLNALISDGKAKVLARPHIITIPGKESSIFIGDHIPVQTEKHSNNENYTTTEYIDAGIKLRYTPILNSDGSIITADVHTEVSTPTLVADLKNYRIASRKIDTHVRMQSGETLIIGGLIGEEEAKSVQRIPLLSKIPLLGHLFKNSSKRKTKNEVLIFLTPYVTEAGKSPAIINVQPNI